MRGATTARGNFLFIFSGLQKYTLSIGMVEDEVVKPTLKIMQIYPVTLIARRSKRQNTLNFKKLKIITIFGLCLPITNVVLRSLQVYVQCDQKAEL